MKECYSIAIDCSKIATYQVQRGIDVKPLPLCATCLLTLLRVEMRENAHQKLNEMAGAVPALSGKLVSGE